MTTDHLCNALARPPGSRVRRVMDSSRGGDAAISGRRRKNETTVSAHVDSSQYWRYAHLSFSRGISHVRLHLVCRLHVAFRLCTGGGPCKLGHVGMFWLVGRVRPSFSRGGWVTESDHGGALICGYLARFTSGKVPVRRLFFYGFMAETLKRVESSSS